MGPAFLGREQDPRGHHPAVLILWNPVPTAWRRGSPSPVRKTWLLNGAFGFSPPELPPGL